METLFGTLHHVTLGQECARAVLVFIFGLSMLRLSGRRTFGRWSALDFILAIIVGSCLSRAMTGGAPLPGTLAAVALLAILHRLLAYAVARSGRISRMVEGHPAILARNGVLDEKICRAHMVSHSDLEEALRRENMDGMGELPRTRRVVLEPSGRITVVKL